MAAVTCDLSTITFDTTRQQVHTAFGRNAIAGLWVRDDAIRAEIERQRVIVTGALGSGDADIAAAAHRRITSLTSEMIVTP